MVEDVEDDVLVEVEFGWSGAVICEQAGANGFGQRFGLGAEGGDVGALGIEMRAGGPDEVGLDKIGPEDLALILDALGEEWIAVGEVGEGLGEGTIRVGEQRHTKNVRY